MFEEGNNNSNWKGGISQYYAIRIAYQKYPHECSICNENKFLCVHHKNRNRKDNDIKNLIIVCKSCHEKIHRKYKNFKLHWWTKEDNNIIKNNYKIMSDFKIAKKLKRTEKSVWHQRIRLGLKKQNHPKRI